MCAIYYMRLFKNRNCKIKFPNLKISDMTWLLGFHENAYSNKQYKIIFKSKLSLHYLSERTHFWYIIHYLNININFK